MPYWYNVETKAVEEGEDRSRDASVMGPYTTREEAQQALDRAHDRTAAWEAEEEAEREEKERDKEQFGSINPFDQG